MKKIKGAKFIAEVPNGTKMMSFQDRVYLAHPSMLLTEVTPEGLKPVDIAPMEQNQAEGEV